MMITPGWINGKERIKPMSTVTLEQAAKHIPPWKREVTVKATVTPIALSFEADSACSKCKKGPLQPRVPTAPHRRRGRPYSPQSLDRALATWQCLNCGTRTRR